MNHEVARRKAQSEYGRLRQQSIQLDNFLGLLPTMYVKDIEATRQEIVNELNKIRLKMSQIKKQLRY